MSDSQLREAYTLMKQGEKAKSIRLVKDLLNQDRSNVNAWWLLAHLLEDEAKIVSALENVLAHNPEHLGARKKLSEMRPEYAHLYEVASEEKVKNGQASGEYWERLDATSAKKNSAKKSPNFGLSIGIFFLAFSLFVIAFVVVGFLVTGINNSNTENQSVNGEAFEGVENTPVEVAKAYNEAYFREDAERLFRLSCEAYHSHVLEIVAEFDSPNRDAIIVDYAETEFVLDKENSNEQYAYVMMHGSTYIKDGGVSLRTDWDSLAEANGYEYYGFDLENINGIWKVCYQ
jgi:hypothetical protein